MDTSKAVFAMNPRLRNAETGEIERMYNRGYAEPGTAEQILGMLQREDLPQMLSEIRDEGKEEVKDQLPTICPHYSQFRNNHRAQADIIPEAFTHKTCTDIDEKSLVEQAIKRALEVNEDEYSEFQGMVEYIDYSPRKKCHIWLRMPMGKTIEETQKAFCEEIGVPYDDSCTTPERYINMTGDEVFRSERWLQPLSDEEIEERREAFLMRGLDVDGRPLKKPETATAPASQPVVQSSMVTPNDKVHYIMNACMKENELEADDFQEEGSRHNNVKIMLSVACQMITREEFIGWLSEVMPDGYWQSNDIQRLVCDFYAKYNDPAQKFTQFQMKVLRESRKLARKNVKTDTKSEVQESEEIVTIPEKTLGSTSTLEEIYACPNPPTLDAKSMPRLVKTATGPVPAEGKEAASQAMFPPMGMYCDAKFVYIDNTPREPRSNCLVMAGTGGGKDSSTKHMLKHLEAPQKAMDGPNRIILEKYKDEYRRKGQNEDKPERPNVAVQSVAADITKARLSELMADSQGRIVHTRMIEFDQWFAVEGWKPGPNCPFTYLKMTDDEDNPFGQERVGSQSVTYQGPLSINWNASTTPSKAVYYFRNSMTDGPISRLNLATIPDRGLGAPMPVHGKYDEKYDAKLKTFIDNLRQVHGVIDCPQARRMTNRLKKELDDFVVQSGDEVLNNLGRRALVATFRKACIIYAANGRKWEKTIEDFCRWSLHYDLWLKLHFFSEYIRNADSQIKTSKRGPANLMEQIAPNAGDVFDKNALVCARLKNGMKEDGTNNMLSQWKKRQLIEELDDGRFRRIALPQGNDK
jgi:hypothetical protein